MDTIFQVTSGGLISVGILWLIVQLLSSEWIKYRLEKSIQHEYNKKLEDYKFLQTQRQKAEIIAKLFARWIKYSGKEEDILDKQDLINYYEELNQMSLELSIWLPDKNLLNQIMARLLNSENSKDIRTLMAQVREIIVGNNDNFDPQKIVLWPNEETKNKLFNNK